MKLKQLFPIVVSIFLAAGASAQQQPQAPSAAPKDNKQGAMKEVSIVDAQGSCAAGLKSCGVINKSTRPMLVKIEALVTFGAGHASRKIITMDNMSPQETRTLGCMGCVDNATGKACTTYKIVFASYK